MLFALSKRHCILSKNCPKTNLFNYNPTNKAFKIGWVGGRKSVFQTPYIISLIERRNTERETAEKFPSRFTGCCRILD